MHTHRLGLAVLVRSTDPFWAWVNRLTVVTVLTAGLVAFTVHAYLEGTFVGSRVEKRYHPLSSSQVRKILKRNTVFFQSAEQAEEAGFVSSKI